MAGYRSLELLSAIRKGAKIVRDVDGAEVKYRPARIGCRMPWVLATDDPSNPSERFRVREVHPVYKDETPQIMTELFRLG